MDAFPQLCPPRSALCAENAPLTGRRALVQVAPLREQRSWLLVFGVLLFAVVGCSKQFLGHGFVLLRSVYALPFDTALQRVTPCICGGTAVYSSRAKACIATVRDPPRLEVWAL